ncbi:MAG TPA: hypothetical protein PLN86_03370 [Candidatus Hydrogenedentes bacterium]|nr:hypothetical protein [Candidatus Hydrogenedentota bacterium]
MSEQGGNPSVLRPSNPQAPSFTGYQGQTGETNSQQLPVKQTLAFQVYVVKATKENKEKQTTNAIPAEVSKTLENLNYRHVTLIKSPRFTTAFGEAFQFNIENRYDVSITPLEKADATRFRIRVLIEENMPMPDGTIQKRKALESVGALVPEKFLSFCGLKLEEGELVLVVSIQEDFQKPNLKTPGVPFWQKAFR